jgi:hypothetical protein
MVTAGNGVEALVTVQPDDFDEDDDTAGQQQSDHRADILQVESDCEARLQQHSGQHRLPRFQM